MLSWKVKNEIANLLKIDSSYCFCTWPCLLYICFLLRDGKLKEAKQRNKFSNNKYIILLEMSHTHSYFHECKIMKGQRETI